MAISMRAFSGVITRDQYLDAARAHRTVACGVGSVIAMVERPVKVDHRDPRALAEAIRVPLAIIRLQKVVFNGLVPARQCDWPAEFGEAIGRNADLGQASQRFLSRVLREVVHPQAGTSPQLMDRVVQGWTMQWAEDSQEADEAVAREAAAVTAAVAGAAQAEAAALDAAAQWEAARGRAEEAKIGARWAAALSGQWAGLEATASSVVAESVVAAGRWRESVASTYATLADIMLAELRKCVAS